MHQRVRRVRMLAGAALLAAPWLGGCPRPAAVAGGDGAAVRDGRVRPGITVLLDDSVHLVRGKRVGLLTNQTGIDERGRSDIDLLREDPRAVAAGVRLVSLFSPEHGIRGTEERENLASGIDERSGLPIHSLYTRGTIGPPDSTLRNLDVLLFDLQEVGTRTWTYVGNLVYALRAVKRNGKAIVVLDRPAPLTGSRRHGPMLDSAIANPEEGTPSRAALAWALWPFPLRHGMTMGELARFYNRELGIGAELHVVPAAGWRRDMWYDETGLPFVRPSPNLPSHEAVLLYPSLVALEATNVSVGRGTPLAHQQFGFPGMDARALAELLESRLLTGVRFEATTFTANRYGAQQPYAAQPVPGVRIVVTDRDRVHSGRLGAAVIWALARTHPTSFTVTDTLRFDRLWGSGAARRALLAGEDPDDVIDRDLPATVAFEQRARQYFLYR